MPEYPNRDDMLCPKGMGFGRHTQHLLTTVCIGLLSAACIEPATTSCGDLVCPVGKVCADEHTICVLPDQVSACEGMPDQTPCSYPGVSEGACTGEVCFDTTCGNSIVEGLEVCDDGNVASGDGCSADCRSNEMCGNGTVDPQVGEACDDGNDVDGDGCQTNCARPECGDGIQDDGEACDDGNNESGDGCSAACISDESCGNNVIDLVNDEQCDDGAFEVGDGCGATCKIEVCGNNIMDPGEVCDDGNTLSTDGCRADCLSDEVCGNGIADTAVGEQCDDGGFQSLDGCSSLCGVELANYEDFTDRGGYEGFRGGAAYDSHRQRTVVFGGLAGGGETSARMYEWTGERFHSIPGAGPPPRAGHIMVYDAARRVVVMFGGESSAAPGSELGDTWEYDELGWRQITPTASPPARTNAGAAYDAARQQVVMYGGSDSTGARDDMWTFNGTTWTQVVVTTPSQRSGHAMTYDASRDRIVLFGGADGATERFDTWEWNGASWSDVTPTTVPVARSAMAYDAARARVVMFGGTGSNNNETWEFVAGDWVQASPTASPMARQNTQMVFDAGRGEVLMISGNQGQLGSSFRDIWRYNGTTWTQAVYQGEAPGRITEGMAYDTLRDKVIMYGGLSPSPDFIPLNDTWEFDGVEWRQMQTRSSPPAGGVAAMAFHQATGLMIMVRDGTPSADLETWSFDGVSWTRLAPTNSPPTRTDTSLAYDENRGVLVLFGGGLVGGMPGPPTPPFGDTWEFDGTNWVETTPLSSPPARGETATAYDAVSQRIIMFGGGIGMGMMAMLLDDTWAYDGTTWVELTLTPSPPARRGVEMARHEARNALVLYRGLAGDNWEFDGVGWNEVITPELPPPGKSPHLTYDRRRRQVVVRAGDPQNTTWDYGYASTAPREQCTSGADDDGDGLTDCGDPDCEEVSCGTPNLVCRAGACVCVGGATEIHCGDNFDDDCDGAIDCADPDCASSTRCMAESNCSNGSDDDNDGYTDCADPGCVGIGVCESFETTCNDGQDNDGDGTIDCLDLDCFLAPCTSVQ